MSFAPITVPSVGINRRTDGVVSEVFVGSLRTVSGPAGFEDRHATLILTVTQAEALVYELAAKLGLEVTP